MFLLPVGHNVKPTAQGTCCMMTTEGRYICILLNSNFKMLLNVRQGWEDVWDRKERHMGWQGKQNC